MQLGMRVKELRTERGLTMAEVAQRADLSRGFISQVESGSASPSIDTLTRIAAALRIPLAYLFYDQGGDSSGEGGRSTREGARVVRKDRRKVIQLPGTTTLTYLLTPDVQRRLQVALLRQNPDDVTYREPWTHNGEEFGLVLEGRLEVTVDGESHLLEEGDSIYYSSDLPHWTKAVDGPTLSLWVITPPSL